MTSTTPRLRGALWTVWVVAALLALDVVGGVAYLVAVLVSGYLLHVLIDPHGGRRAPVARDLAVMGVLYLAVVGLLAAAFRGFGTDRTLGLFLCFGTALVLGVAGPVYYTVRVQRRPLADLGLRVGDWRTLLGLALLFAGVQFGLTLWGYDLPAPVDWVPLLVMALAVGVFESVFFRGFLQGRLQEHFGDLPGVLLAAVAYGAYHVGYGMGLEEMLFLTGLGVVYAVAFALTRSLLVLWPLLTPVGSWFAQLEAGDIELPWASIMGFLDVLGLMALAFWWARRHGQDRPSSSAADRTPASAATRTAGSSGSRPASSS